MSETATYKSRIESLGPWFHNIVFPDGTSTNPARPGYPQELWDEVFSVLPRICGLNVLDVGCNGGWMVRELEKLGAGFVVAVDREPRHVDQTKLVKEAFDLSGYVAQADLEYPLPGDCRLAAGMQFDLTLLLGVIYHVDNPIAVLRNVFDVTKDYVIVESNVNGATGSSADFCDIPLNQPGYKDRWLPSLSCLQGMIRHVGGKVVETKRRECGRYILKCQA